MPSTAYDLVRDDHDLRIPLHAEQAFFHGITFQAKLIGWQEVPRPSSRTEIVQAMRRIRYDCKLQNTKKRKVTIKISVEGIRVILKKKKRKKKQWNDELDIIELMQHPIYRIFYVSHDSNDLKIFSYIARDGSSDTFKCSVFKSNKKSQAMRIVRTVGQAFEVCHKFNLQNNSLNHNDDHSDIPCDISDHCSERITDEDEPKKDRLQNNSEIVRPNHLDISADTNFNFRKLFSEDVEKTKTNHQQFDASTELQHMREQLEQQTIHTKQALAQLMLVREQLITETNARIEAQARTQQLLQQNRELLEHLASLGRLTEQDRPAMTATSLGLAPQLSTAAKVARWVQQLNSNNHTSLSRPESGFVSGGDSRSEKYQQDQSAKKEDCDKINQQYDEIFDEYLLVDGANSLWRKFSTKKRKRLLGLKLGKITTF